MSSADAIGTHQSQPHVDPCSKPGRRARLHVALPVDQQRVPHARLPFLHPQQRVHLFPECTDQEPPQRILLVERTAVLLGIFRQQLDGEGDRDGDPAVTSGPERLGKVVTDGDLFRGEFPAVEPETGDSVHKILNVKHELVFCCRVGRR